jgi:hypothetical protein
MAAPLPNLYLKWRVFREMIGHAQSDKQIAEKIYGPDGAIKFTRLLYGDAGVSPAIASELIGVVNQRLEVYRKAQQLPAQGKTVLSALDLGLPVYEFARQLLAAADAKVSSDALERTHRTLLEEIAPRSTAAMPLLKIERYSLEKAFESVLPSGGDGPIKFRAGRDTGRLVVEGSSREPAAAYVLFVRDTAPLGRHLWELAWGETVGWLSSPFKPTRHQKAYVLMDTQPVRADAGRFLVTAVLLYDPDLIVELDPRGTKAIPGALDEMETARFLTRLRRLEKSRAKDLVVACNEYVVNA